MFHPKTKQAYKLFHHGALALAKAERQGIRIDLDTTKKTVTELEDKIHALERNFYESTFYKEWRKSLSHIPNIYSNHQLGIFLYEVKKYTPIKETSTGKGSTDEEALTQLNIQELDDLLQIKKLKKLKDTYLEGFIREQVNGFIHPSFNLHLVVTYRSSSDKPNFQNIPVRDEEAKRYVRQLLYPRIDHQLMEVDYSQLEVCIAACYHKDPTMIKYIVDNHDMHADIAKQVFFIDRFDNSKPEHKLLRSAAKNGFVFPQFYGDWFKPCAVSLASRWGKLPEKGSWRPGQGIEFEGKHLSDQLIKNGIKSLSQYVNYIEEVERHFWFTRFSVYSRWKERHWRKYQKTGYVDLFTGFRCQRIMGKNDVINYPVQGATFHCLLWSLIEITGILEKNNMKTKIIGQIHDAILFDVFPDEKDEVKQICQNVMTKNIIEEMPWIIVPLKIEFDVAGINKSWADVKPEKINL